MKDSTFNELDTESIGKEHPKNATFKKIEYDKSYVIEDVLETNVEIKTEVDFDESDTGTETGFKDDSKNAPLENVQLVLTLRCNVQGDVTETKDGNKKTERHFDTKNSVQANSKTEKSKVCNQNKELDKNQKESDRKVVNLFNKRSKENKLLKRSKKELHRLTYKQLHSQNKLPKKDVKKRKKNDHSKVETSKKFECDLCSKAYVTQGHVNRHVNEFHEKKRLFPCKQCNSSFPRSDQLREHVKFVHLKQKLHKCPICSRLFGQKGLLNVHISTVHEKKKPHTCQECGKNFGENKNLTSHMKTHFDIFEFTCLLCNKYKTNRKWNLMRHHPKCKMLEEKNKPQPKLS